jgi:hypothetical protein
MTVTGVMIVMVVKMPLTYAVFSATIIMTVT